MFSDIHVVTAERSGRVAQRQARVQAPTGIPCGEGPGLPGVRRAPDGLPEGVGVLGGDDVLALLPLNTVLETADRLRRCFFEKTGKHTLSAGLVFAHYTTPLRLVLETAKNLLEEDAKKTNGRNSIALAVLKRGGEVARWMSHWNTADGRSVIGHVTHMVDAFSSEDERSSAFVHNIEERYRDVRVGPDGAVYVLVDDLEGDVLRLVPVE